MIGMGFEHHAKKREDRHEGGVCVLERGRAAREGLVSVQGQNNILK